MSLGIHGAATIAFFFFLSGATGAVWRSVFAAALFGVHPLHVESVAWAAERKDVLSGLFFMLVVLAYARYARRPTLKRYLPVPLLFALGLLAKPMLVTLPFVLLLLDYWPLERLGDGAPLSWTRLQPLLLEKVPLLALSTIASIVTYGAQAAGGALEAEPPAFGFRLANAAVAAGRYLLKTAYPIHLSFLYPFPAGGWAYWQSLGAAACLVIVSASVVISARTRPFLPVGWFWFLGMLVPVIGLVQIGGQSMADRYTYLPLAGIFVAITWWLSDLARNRRHLEAIQVVCAASVVLLMVGVTRVQVSHWRNSRALLEQALAVTRENYAAHGNLGLLLLRQGKADEALRHLRELTRLRPSFAEGHLNLGVGLAETGNITEALTQYREAIKSRPDYPEARFNLGIALYRLGRDAEAAESLRRAIEQRPGYAKAWYGLGLVMARNGRQADAATCYKEALMLDPSLPGVQEAREAL